MAEQRDQGSGIRDQRSGIRHQASGIRDQASGIRDQGSGIRDQASGIRDQTSGIRDQGSGIRDCRGGSYPKGEPPADPHPPRRDGSQPSAVVLQETAYGKLNLTLDVLGKRPDGYHELEMVMVSVSLADQVTLELGGGGGWSLSCDREDLPGGSDNLCWRAARAYCDAAGVDPAGLRIDLRKNIPAQAGMAGGSSDAAAVLRALNRHYGRFRPEELRALGLTVGSDVPYCLFGGVALARGRGEVLTRLPNLPEELYFVLVKPDFAVSTPALFREIDAKGVPVRPDTQAMLAALTRGDRNAIGACLQNAFEPLVAETWPVVEEIRRTLLAHEALGARLTGTGSVVYGLFSSKYKAISAALILREQYPEVHLAVGVSG